MPTIRSEELFAFLLQANTFPCSVPTMNLVGMVGSYSRQEAPWAFSVLPSSSFTRGSSTSRSSGELNFRMSHHRT